MVKWAVYMHKEHNKQRLLIWLFISVFWFIYFNSLNRFTHTDLAATLTELLAPNAPLAYAPSASDLDAANTA